jgi:hypothetical protein
MTAPPVEVAETRRAELSSEDLMVAFRKATEKPHIRLDSSKPYAQLQCWSTNYYQVVHAAAGI